MAERCSMNDKKSLPNAGVDPMPPLSRRVCLIAFEANVTEPVATCFQGK